MDLGGFIEEDLLKWKDEVLSGEICQSTEGSEIWVIFGGFAFV